MKHPRTLIREAVKERLVAQLLAIDPRITASRISIHRSTQPNADPGLRYRKLDLSVEIITSGDAAAEEADVLAQAVEATLDLDETLGLLVEGTRLTRTEVDQGGEGDTPVLAARLSFEVSYWTKPVIDDGVLPLQVLVSWVPEIGTGHEHSYQPVGTHYREPGS